MAKLKVMEEEISEGDSIDQQGNEEPEQAEETEPSAYTRLEQAHYAEIREMEIEVGRLDDIAEDAKSESSAAKKAFELADARLRAFIHRGPNPQMQLPLDASETPATEPWREVKFSDLALSEKITEVLDGHSIYTIGDWVDAPLKKGCEYTQLKGITEKRLEVISEAVNRATCEAESAAEESPLFDSVPN